nr:SsrA-binding protein [Mycoplasma suis]
MSLTSKVVGEILKGSLNLLGSYGKVIGSELFLVNFAASKWRLLLTRREINQISDLVKREKYVIIPGGLFLQNRKIKVELNLCKYNRNYEKETSKKYKRNKRNKYSDDEY